eukprot:CAMPEP_0202895228 /NCGR_PEP_ID=MMETSP1392-20130828/4473_1 /ASSEMBLY_ACC=CAM_ASM_000868 /TAXON_ID=225041 /ORGANISM="Chlamydomonas chlamydogama, Strain SAG 11-48b" /LENGTH=228 /DNA_ID=CAMNT_0049580165 /DNA_START=1565 /DNA_END=2252 /DNA_ORIENTATION=-
MAEPHGALHAKQPNASTGTESQSDFQSAKSTDVVSVHRSHSEHFAAGLKTEQVTLHMLTELLATRKLLAAYVQLPHWCHAAAVNTALTHAVVVNSALTQLTGSWGMQACAAAATQAPVAAAAAVGAAFRKPMITKCNAWSSEKVDITTHTQPTSYKNCSQRYSTMLKLHAGSCCPPEPPDPPQDPPKPPPLPGRPPSLGPSKPQSSSLSPPVPAPLRRTLLRVLDAAK